ncbi:MAG: glycosyltransferase family 2 protein [Flavobacterium sp.]
MKPIAIVILNWNGKALLEKFLPSVVKYSQCAQIYVADNASTDESEVWVQKNYPEVVWIAMNENRGFAGGYNTALPFVNEPILGLVNSDIEVTENWLNPILKTFEKYIDAAIVQPKILDAKARDYFEYAGAGGGFIDAFGYPYCRGRVFDTLEKDNGQYNDITEIFWASGACLFIKKEVFHKLGGFDDTFFAHQEEIDLCWRAFHNNYKVYYCGESTVYHLGGATLSNLSPKKTYLNFRNSLFMLLKNLPYFYILPVVFGRMILDGIAGIRFLFQGKFQHFKMVLWAHFHFYLNILQLLRKRKSISNKRYFRKFSIVFDYFIKGQKIFNN